MSKPNLLQFGTAVGFYRNIRVREFHDLLQKAVRIKVDFAELAPMLFQVVMAAAAENQINGDFSNYSDARWREIFATNHIPLTQEQATLIRKNLEAVGLLEGGKIRSWMKFNRHLADYEGIVRARRQAGKISAKRREQEAKSALKNGHNSPKSSDENPENNGSETTSPSKQLWLIEKALETAKGPAKKELLAQKKKLLADSTGVDLSEPAPAPAAPQPKATKSSPAQFQRALLNSGRTLIADSPDLLTEGMVKALVAAGDELPDQVRHRFPKLLAELESRNNPVPE